MDAFFVAERRSKQPHVGAAERRFGRGKSSSRSSHERSCSVFARGGVCRFGDQCRFSHAAPVRASGLQVASFRKVAVAGGTSGNGNKRKVGIPKRNAGKLCKNFSTGTCTFGDECRFSHGNDGRLGSDTSTHKLKRLCRTFQKDGSCRWGDKCKFVHSNTAIAKAKSKAAVTANAHTSQASTWSNSFGNSAKGNNGDVDENYSSDGSDSSDSSDSNDDSSSMNDPAYPHGSSVGSARTIPRNVATIEDLDHAAALVAAAPVQSGGSSSDDSSDYSSSDEDSGDEVSMGARLRQRRDRADRSHFHGDRQGTWDDAQNRRPIPRYDDHNRRNDGPDLSYDDDEATHTPLGASLDDVSSSDEDSVQNDASLQERKIKKKKKPRNRAPAEMSSKKAVTRYRVVVPNSEVSSIRKRDPRFDTLSGKLNRGHWETAYGFIDDYKKSEIQHMRKTAKKAKTEEERDQIQAILSKEMNRVAERERWKNRREIVQSHRRKERLAIAHGQKKNPYFMKRKDLKRKELEIKFDTLKKEGRLGKYMEKRRKKNSQKDRKRMPRNFS